MVFSELPDGEYLLVETARAGSGGARAGHQRRCTSRFRDIWVLPLAICEAPWRLALGMPWASWLLEAEAGLPEAARGPTHVRLV